MSDPEPVLLPQPQRMVRMSGEAPYRAQEIAHDPSLPAQGYRLRIEADRIRIDSADDAGTFYARATLAQLRRVYGERLPVMLVEDWPDLAVRGVMLDVSRDKVPTLGTLKALVDRLASWKINHLELYIEHTFAHAGHEEVWQQASPYTCEDIRELDRYCRERHIELTPNRNCLGHMERWLRHDRYRPLAVSDDGWKDPFGRRHPPSTLDPSNAASLALVRELLAGMLPCFTSARVHVGLDEPFELPTGRIDEYADYLERLRAVPELAGREMLVWGDVLCAHPPLLERVPDGVTVCVWGYEQWWPFDQQVGQVRQAGRRAWVCPGTSSWLTLVGRWTNAARNLRAAADAAATHGADGYLITDWGDRGHLQYPAVSEPGFAYGAALAWCRETNAELDVPRALDLHAFADEAGRLGAVLCELGDLYRLVTPRIPNMSALCLPLYQPDVTLGRDWNEGLTTDELRTVSERIGWARTAIGEARPGRSDGDLVLEELRTSCALLALLCRDARARLEGDGSLRSVPEPVRRGLAEDLQPIIERHSAHWLARNRPGGLEDSRRRLEDLLRAYESPP